MSKEIAVIYAQIYGLCVDLSLVPYMDPGSFHLSAITNNYHKLCQIQKIIGDHLLSNNSQTPCALTLELEHLLSNAIELCKNILSHENTCTPLLCNNQCLLDMSCMVCFYGGDTVDVPLDTINKVDMLFKKLNVTFYCTSFNHTMPLLRKVFAQLGKFRGLSPIPSPGIYDISQPCIQCLQQVEYLPNQGLSKDTLLRKAICNHVFPMVPPEPIDFAQVGPSPSTVQKPSEDAVVMARPQAMVEYNVFSVPTSDVLQLSNLLYWTSSDQLTTSSNIDCSNLSNIYARENMLLTSSEKVGQLCHRALKKHTPSPFELLFTGGLVTEHSKIVSALKDDCTASFLKKTNYADSLKHKNEMFASLQSLLTGSSSSQKLSQEKVSQQDRPEKGFAHDAHKRKEAYLKKLADEGLKRLTNSLDANIANLEKLLGIRIWGQSVYEELAKLLNHFLIRNFLIQSASPPDWTLEETRERSQFIKSILYGHSINKEHVQSLGTVYYRLLNGPLIQERGLFKLPINIILAQSLDAAEVLPHQKISMCFDVTNIKSPKDWIDVQFNQFYNFLPNTPLAGVQEQAWRYIRELVLSVTVYNVIWEKSLSICSPSDFQNIKDFEARSVDLDTVCLTFETSCPLILISKNQLRVFKDIYSMLNYHLYI
uniref:DNA packaging terminase subunit 2 n=1 Tax=Wood mouse herpesvirus TaxID=432370 RepID=D0PP99_9GAMA|nr:DNA packaging terminase subunit 2 [Wood mouse herpesvirus]